MFEPGTYIAIFTLCITNIFTGVAAFARWRRGESSKSLHGRPTAASERADLPDIKSNQEYELDYAREEIEELQGRIGSLESQLAGNRLERDHLRALVDRMQHRRLIPRRLAMAILARIQKRSISDGEWAELEALTGLYIPLEGKVIEVFPDGLVLDVGAIGFLPMERTAATTSNLERFIGHVLSCRVVSCDARNRTVELTRSSAAGPKTRLARHCELSQLAKGQILSGYISEYCNGTTRVEISPALDAELVDDSAFWEEYYELEFVYRGEPSKDAPPVGEPVRIEVTKVEMYWERLYARVA